MLFTTDAAEALVSQLKLFYMSASPITFAPFRTLLLLLLLLQSGASEDVSWGGAGNRGIGGPLRFLPAGPRACCPSPTPKLRVWRKAPSSSSLASRITQRCKSPVEYDPMILGRPAGGGGGGLRSRRNLQTHLTLPCLCFVAAEERVRANGEQRVKRAQPFSLFFTTCRTNASD
jgi:hypothetical protein